MISFRGGQVDARGVQVRDGNIADGSASVLVWQRGITATVFPETSRYGLTLKTTRLPRRLRFDLSARTGTFSKLDVSGGGEGQTIVLALTRAPPRPKSLRAAAIALFEAWKSGDRTAAGVAAEKPAIAKLFAEPFPDPRPELIACYPAGTDTLDCQYQYEEDGAPRTVGLRAVRKGDLFRVESVAFFNY